MKIYLEVCVDNIESVRTCSEVGVDRLELCSALALGGLTPAYSTVAFAVENSGISCHSMIRPRAGDFLFDFAEIDAMKKEIEFMAGLGIDGIVTGVLNRDFTVNADAMKILADKAKDLSLEVTFHRAGDFCQDYKHLIDTLVSCGVDRLLTSGMQSRASEGVEMIRMMKEFSGNSIQIMAGSGINEANVSSIIGKTGVNHVHCSASCRLNRFKDAALRLGDTSSDLAYQVTDKDKLQLIKSRILETGLLT